MIESVIYTHTNTYIYIVPPVGVILDKEKGDTVPMLPENPVCAREDTRNRRVLCIYLGGPEFPWAFILYLQISDPRICLFVNRTNTSVVPCVNQLNSFIQI